MIEMTIKHTCRACQSENIIKNGRNAFGKQQYRCKDCGAYKVLEPTLRYGQERKEEILRAYQERASLRGISRAFGVSRPTVTAWLKKTQAVAVGGGRLGQGKARRRAGA
jgi:insertion element IS1 protein InsB